MAEKRPRSALNDLITKNARKAIRRHAREEIERGKPTFDRARLVREMAAWMPRPPGKPEENHIAMVRVGLAAMVPENPERPPTRLWRADFIEALCTVTETSPHRLVHADFEGEGKLEEASYAAMLARLVGHQLPNGVARTVIRQLREGVTSGRVEVGMQISAAFLASPTREAAKDAIYQLLSDANPEVWQPPRPARKKISKYP